MSSVSYRRFNFNYWRWFWFFIQCVVVYSIWMQPRLIQDFFKRFMRGSTRFNWIFQFDRLFLKSFLHIACWINFIWIDLETISLNVNSVMKYHRVLSWKCFIIFLFFFLLITVLKNCKNLIFSSNHVFLSLLWLFTLNLSTIVKEIFKFSSYITFFLKFFLFHFPFIFIIILLFSPFVYFWKIKSGDRFYFQFTF